MISLSLDIKYSCRDKLAPRSELDRQTVRAGTKMCHKYRCRGLYRVFIDTSTNLTANMTWDKLSSFSR